MNALPSLVRLTVLLASAAAAAQAPAQAPTPSPAPRIAVADCEKRVAAGKAVIVDVRDPAAYNASHIAGALSIPLDDVGAKAYELKKGGKADIAYCG